MKALSNMNMRRYAPGLAAALLAARASAAAPEAANVGAPPGAENVGAPPTAANVGTSAPEPVVTVAAPAPAPVPAPPASSVAPRPVVVTQPGLPEAPRPGLLLLKSNIRASYKLAAAVSLYGVSQGLGLVVEYMPHWVASFGFGIGGTARLIKTTTPTAAGNLHAEINLMPLPFAVTPILGGGFGFTFGPLAEYLPGLPGKAPDRDQSVRLLPYARVGLRVDLRRSVHLIGEVLLVPDSRLQQGNSIHPLPGLRVGFSVL